VAKKHGRARDKTALRHGARAPGFALQDSPHSQVALADFRGRPVVLVFYVADWQPVATAQLGLFQELLPHLERPGAAVLGISIDATWSHQEYARAIGLTFPLLSDASPPGEVARAYGVYVAQTGRSQRALFVIDQVEVVRWSSTFPDALNPGADGVLSALEELGFAPRTRTDNRHGHDTDACPCGCGVRLALLAGGEREV
jgi:peroxiredoxin